MNPNCRIYALPSLCFSILPICRTPDLTNKKYFMNKSAADLNLRHSKRSRSKFKKKATTTQMASSTTTSSSSELNDSSLTDDDHDDDDKRNKRSFDVTVDARTKNVKHFMQPGTTNVDVTAALKLKEQFLSSGDIPPTRNTENLRRICRDECELLENELCQMEYAIAKRHPTIGQKLPLEECEFLPEESDCMPLGIAIDAIPEEDCYWENGAGYRGTMSVAASGRSCLKWAKLMKSIADYPELAGQNYCRNPGGTDVQPWCYVEGKTGKKEHCNIPKCADKLWLYVIFGFVAVATILVTIASVIVCRKIRKNGTTNIQNVSSPIFVNSKMCLC